MTRISHDTILRYDEAVAESLKANKKTKENPD